MEGGAFINMDFWESEIWGAFIFEDFINTMEGAFISIIMHGIQWNVFDEICVAGSQGGESEGQGWLESQGIELWLPVFTQYLY